MGADFLLTAIPKFKRTKERQKQLLKILDTINFGDDDEDSMGHSKQSYIDSINDFFSNDFTDYRDCTTMEFNDIPYIFTGGMSWGDEPTDSFFIINILYDLFCSFEDDAGGSELYEEWVKEDLKKTKGKK